jgi:hypothetical protein
MTDIESDFDRYALNLKHVQLSGNSIPHFLLLVGQDCRPFICKVAGIEPGVLLPNEEASCLCGSVGDKVLYCRTEHQIVRQAKQMGEQINLITQ